MHDNSIDPWIKRRHDEQNCWSEGYNHVMGCDEVGRGALAGPCVAGAVILSPEFYLAELRDSKEATAKMRRTWTKAIIHGDTMSAVIAAASIVAKVYRDELMTEYAKIYPEYGFERNKGYPTQKHMDTIRQIGPCPQIFDHY